MTSHRRLRAASWIAMLAIVASVLAPVATRALAAWSGGSSPWDEICTSLGITKTPVQAAGRGSEQPVPQDGARMQAECPYCVPSAQPVALPAAPSSVPPAAEPGTSRFLFFFISAPHGKPVPVAARPRAPPQVA